MSRPSALDIAWVAGLFEGEGCITLGQKPHHLALIVRMTDEDVVERLHDFMGGRVHETERRPPRKRIWTWQARGSEAATILPLLIPYFGIRRRERAETLLAQFTEHVKAVTFERECAHCGRDFRPTYSARSLEQRFCASRCRNLARGRGWKEETCQS